MGKRKRADTASVDQPIDEDLEYFNLTLMSPRPTPFEITIKAKETRWSRFRRWLTGRR